MKTVFQRALSVLMCVVLIACTMSTMAFAATDFQYDRYFDISSKSVEKNIIPAFDEVEGILDESMVIDLDKEIEAAGISIPFKLGVIDLSSINGALKTLDDFSGKIESISNWFSHLNTLTFKEFQTGMTREKSGDIKILSELLELAAMNADIFKDIFSGTFSLGLLDALFEGEEGEEGFSFSEIPGIAKEIFVTFVYDEEKEPEKYQAALTKANSNFDKYICEDFLPFLTALFVETAGLDPAENKIEISTSTDINSLVAQIINIILNYLKETVGELNVVLADTTLDAIKNDLILNGAEFTEEQLATVKALDPSKPVLNQINTAFGQIFALIVPNYNYSGWADKDLGANISGVFRFLAGKLNVTTKGKSDEYVMVEVLKLVFAEPEINVPGNYSGCTNMEALAKEFIRALAVEAGKLPADVKYTSKQTYEHVLGDIIINEFKDDVIIATPDGKICNVGEGYDVWTVWNYILNFFLVDKNFDLLIGKDGMEKPSTVFTKLDTICDMFAMSGSSSFDTNDYFTKLIGSILDVNFTEFVNLTAGKALNFAKEKDSDAAGSVSVSKFTYNTMYAVLRNWAGRNIIPAWTTNPFHNAFKGENLGIAVENLFFSLAGCKYEYKKVLGIETNEKNLVSAGKSRANAIASLIGLLIPGPETASIEVSSVADAVYTGKTLNPKAVVKATFAGKTYTLEQGVDYIVKVAKNAVGSTGTTIEGIGAYKGTTAGKNITVKFGTLSGLKATPASASSVKLTWSALTGAKTYNIYNGSKLVKSGVTGTSYTVSGLSAGTAYTFGVEAVSGSVKSNKVTVSATTLPDKVSGLNASASASSASLSWSAVKGATGYYVQQKISGSWKTVATVKTTSATVSGLSANSPYSFRVIAYSSAGNGEASDLSVRTLLKTPSSFTQSAKGITSVTIKWAAVSGATGYQIYDSNGKKIADTKSTSYTIKSLAANNTYKYKVRAYVTASGKTYYSSFTSLLSASTYFAKPADLKLSKATASTLTLKWAAVSGATGYQIYDSNGKKIASTKSTSYTIKGLSVNKSYKYKVRAYVTVGDNTYYSSFTSLLSASTYFATPNSLKVKEVATTSATLTWKAVTGADGYEIYDGNGKKIDSVTKTSYTKKKLKSGTAYKYKVRAYVKENGKTYYSGYSSTVTATTLLAAPKSLTVKEATATSLTVSWKKATGAKKYELYYSTNKGKKWKKVTTTKTSYKIEGLKANTDVQIKVRVYNSSKSVSAYTSVLKTSTAPAKVAISKFSGGKGKLTVTWKKVAGAAGYELQYATSDSFKKAKTVKIKKGSTVKSEVKKLKKGKYYVRVRAYKTVGDEILYGKYSIEEEVKVK